MNYPGFERTIDILILLLRFPIKDAILMILKTIARWITGRAAAW